MPTGAGCCATTRADSKTNEFTAPPLKQGTTGFTRQIEVDGNTAAVRKPFGTGTVAKRPVNLEGVVNQRVREFSRFRLGGRAETRLFSSDPVPNVWNQRARFERAINAKSLCGLGIYANTPSTLALGVGVNQMGY
jgi:hypothetical protein